MERQVVYEGKQVPMKDALTSLMERTPEERRHFFLPREGTDIQEEADKFMLWKRLYSSTTFYLPDGEMSEMSDKLLLKTMRREVGFFETLTVSCPGAGKTSTECANAAWRCAYGLESAIIYQSSVRANIISWMTNLIKIMTHPYFVRDFGELIPERTEKRIVDKKRQKRISSFVLNNGIHLMAQTAGTSFRGVRSVYADIESKPSYIIFDDTVNVAVSKSDRKKETIVSMAEEAKRSRDPSRGVVRWLSNMTKYPNIAQDIIESRSVPYLIMPATKPAKYFDGTKEVSVAVDSTTNFPSKWALTDREAAEHNRDDLGTRFHVGSLEREKQVMGVTYKYEFECVLPNVAGRLFPIPDMPKVDIITKVHDGIEVEYWDGEYNKEGVRRVVASDIGLGRGDGDPSAVICIDETGKVVAHASSRNHRPEQWASLLVSMFHETESEVIAPENNSIGYATVVALKDLIEPAYIYQQDLEDRKTGKSQIYGFSTSAQSKERIISKMQTNCETMLIPFSEVHYQVRSMSIHDLMKRSNIARDHNFDYVMAVAIGNFVVTTPAPKFEFSII